MPSHPDLKLNLPQTTFPMRANLPKLERQMLAWWKEIGLYERVRLASQSRKQIFVLHDGPPYANGRLHLGHALNKILKDMIVKSKSLDGFNAPYVPGWDCHGLPIEHEVEKKMGRGKARADAKAFRQACRAFAHSQIAQQKEGFIKMGVLGDWARPYTTMSPRSEANILRSLGRIYENGHLRYGLMPVYWCRDCQSALAEAEIEYADHESCAIDVCYSVESDEALKRCFGIHTAIQAEVLIWTTTPWTLPASRAVVAHPEMTYVLVQVQNSARTFHLIVAEALVAAVCARCGLEPVQVLAQCQGRALTSLSLRHPYLDESLALLCADYVTQDEGTGLVHTAPAHGRDDFMTGQAHGLVIQCPVDARGVFLETTPLVAGLNLEQAQKVIVRHLKEQGRLLSESRYAHSYPHCWRHKTPILFRTTGQWFIDLDEKGLRQCALKAIEDVNFVPEWGRRRLQSMIENRPDWCVSRQRYWGVPIALWIHRDTHQPHPRSGEWIERIAQRMEQDGIEAWFELDSAEFLGEECCHYHKVTDVLDVWFDSGSSHYAVLRDNQDLTHPADLYLEGSDQHRGWFQSSLLTGCAMDGYAPYKGLLTHGFTVDEQGFKLSKSLGNMVDLDQIMAQNGAEIIRLWVASVDYANEVAASKQILDRIVDSYRRIRNTARYILGNLYDFDPDKRLPPEQLQFLDRYALHELGKLYQEVREHYQRYAFHLIYHRIRHYCVVILGGFYLDVLKDRLYTYAPDSTERRSAQTVLYHIIELLVRLLAPILSFTAEEIWRHLPHRPHLSVFEDVWQPPPQVDFFASDAECWKLLSVLRRYVLAQLEQMRQHNKIGGSLEAQVEFNGDEQVMKVLSVIDQDLSHFLAEYLIVSEVRLTSSLQEAVVDEAKSWGRLNVRVTAMQAPKCPRCWRLSEALHGCSQNAWCPRCEAQSQR